MLRQVIDWLAVAVYAYFVVGVLYWYATLRYEGGWFPSLRGMRVAVTWGLLAYRRLRARL